MKQNQQNGIGNDVARKVPQQLTLEEFAASVTMHTLTNHGRKAEVFFNGQCLGFVDALGVDGLRQAHKAEVNNALYANSPGAPEFLARPLPSVAALSEYPELVALHPEASAMVLSDACTIPQNDQKRENQHGEAGPASTIIEVVVPANAAEFASEPTFTARMRIVRIEQAMKAWHAADETADDFQAGEVSEYAAIMMLADLRHYCDAHGLDFAQLDRQAYIDYVDQVENDRHHRATPPSM